MDLRVFYQKIRKLEKELEGEHIVVVSNETPDGGRSGRIVEVSRPVAAQMIVEGRARLATAEERVEHRAALERGAEAVRRRELGERARVRLLSDADIDALRTAIKPGKG